MEDILKILILNLVNCYGVKPDAKERDEQYMHAINHSPALSDEELNEANNKITNIEII